MKRYTISYILTDRYPASRFLFEQRIRENEFTISCKVNYNTLRKTKERKEEESERRIVIKHVLTFRKEKRQTVIKLRHLRFLYKWIQSCKNLFASSRVVSLLWRRITPVEEDPNSYVIYRTLALVWNFLDRNSRRNSTSSLCGIKYCRNRPLWLYFEGKKISNPKSQWTKLFLSFLENIIWTMEDKYVRTFFLRYP